MSGIDPGHDRVFRFRHPGLREDVRVRVPAELAGAVDALFPTYRRDPAEDARPAVELTVERERVEPPGYRLRRPGGLWRVHGPSDTLVALEQALSETLLGLLREARGLRVLHAGGALLGGGAVLFPGFGGAGKSTLTVACALAGRPVLGDDVVLLDRSGRVHPFERLLKVDDATRRRLSIPRPGTALDPLWPESVFLRPGALGSAWAPGPARLARVLFPARSDGAPPSLRPLPTLEAVRRLLEQALLVEGPTGEDFEAVAAALEGARCEELLYGEAPEAVAFLLEEAGERRGVAAAYGADAADDGSGDGSGGGEAPDGARR